MNRECISYEQACKRYDDFLDVDGYGEVVIANIRFSASRILRELDPIAYREEVLNYTDNYGCDIMEYEE